MLSAENIQRQVTIVAVVPVKEPAFLFAVNRIIRGIKIQNDFFGRFGVSIKKQFDEQFLETFGVMDEFAIPILWVQFSRCQFQTIQRAV